MPEFIDRLSRIADHLGLSGSTISDAPAGFPAGSFSIGPMVFTPVDIDIPHDEVKEPIGKLLGAIFGSSNEVGNIPDNSIEQAMPRAFRPGVGVKGGIHVPPQETKPHPMFDRETIATEDNGFHLRQNDLRVVHIVDTSKPDGGMTIAYKRPTDYKAYPGKGRASTVDVSTAICHPKDRFNKKEGTRIAISNFLAGKVIRLPIIGDDIAQTLRMYFDPVVTR